MGAYCLLEQCKERCSVSNHSLDILPLVLQAEGEAGVRPLRVLLNNHAEGLHRRHPFTCQLRQPQLLCLGAYDEAAEITLPSQVVDLEAKSLKGLAGNNFFLRIADVVQLAGLGEVAVLRPKLHEEVETASIGQ